MTIFSGNGFNRYLFMKQNTQKTVKEKDPPKRQTSKEHRERGRRKQRKTEMGMGGRKTKKYLDRETER